MPLRAKPPKKTQPRKPKILILGEPGVGKTYVSLDFPSVYYIDCEGGATLDHYTDKLHASGGVYLGPDDGANDFDVVIEQVMELAKSSHDYRTLVIDSYSKLFNTRITTEYEKMDRAGRDMTKTFGAEKKPAVNLTKRMIAWFDRLDMNVLLICHERNKWDGDSQVGHTFDGWDKLEYELDLTMRIVKTGPSRSAVVGKSRLAEFTTGEKFPWCYDEFAKRYGAQVIEAASTHVEPATAAQVERVESLSQLLKLEPEMKLKWFDKAGVTNWRQMDTATIDRCISHLAKMANSLTQTGA